MIIQDILTILLFSLVLSFLLAFPIIRILYRFGIVRKLDVDFSVLVESRKSKYGTPIMGGLIIIIPVVILNLVFELSTAATISIIVFAISALLGAIDDVLNIYGTPRKIRSTKRILKLIKVHKNYLYRVFLFFTMPWHIFKRIFFVLGSNPGKGLFAHEKIIVQLMASLIVAYWVLSNENWVNFGDVWVPFFGVLNISYFIVPLIVIGVVGMTNAVNLADGLDGLSAGLLLPAFSAFLVIAFQQEIQFAESFRDMPMTVLIATVIGALIAYLYFNIPPARFQMGDVGSLALGALLAVISFTLRVPLLLPIIAFPFVAEISSTIIQSIGRKLLGRRIFKMAPLHHHFEMVGWREEKVVMRFWIAGIVFALVGLWIYFVANFPL